MPRKFELGWSSFPFYIIAEIPLISIITQKNSHIYGIRLLEVSLMLILKIYSISKAFQKSRKLSWQEETVGDFPGGPVVETSLSSAGGAGSIPGRGAKIPHTSWPKNQNLKKKKKKQKQYCNKLNEDLKKIKKIKKKDCVNAKPQNVKIFAYSSEWWFWIRQNL